MTLNQESTCGAALALLDIVGSDDDDTEEKEEDDSSSDKRKLMPLLLSMLPPESSLERLHSRRGAARRRRAALETPLAMLRDLGGGEGGGGKDEFPPERFVKFFSKTFPALGREEAGGESEKKTSTHVSQRRSDEREAMYVQTWPKIALRRQRLKSVAQMKEESIGLGSLKRGGG